MEIKLLPASKNELPQVAKLAHEIWHEHYPSIIGLEQVEYMLGKFYALPAMEKQVEDGHRFYFIETDGQIMGFVSLSYQQDELFIHKFYILTGKQKSGLGTKVLAMVKDLYPQTRLMRLTVNRQNFKSINFYFKNGFTIEQVEDFDIGNGYLMNDFVMVRKEG